MRKYYSPKQSKKTNAKIFSTLTILIIIIGLVASAWFVLQILNPVKIESGTTFTITKGEGVNQISYNLKQAGIIRNMFAFETYAYLKDVERKFIAGEYNLPAVVNIKRLTEILTSGQPADEWKLMIIEGWTINDIAFKLESLGLFQAEELFAATGFNQPNNKFSFDISNYKFLDDLPPHSNLEGYLFPDTYHYFSYATIDDILRKMLNNFDKKLTPALRAEIKTQGKSIYEIITMASIIEHEVMSDQDRAIVSGIFWKRLDAGMALQADSTINYITGKKTPAVSQEDLKINSPYNTYMYPGLPPGPISNPGLASIKAAIYPEESDYWFFLTDEDGRVYYAKDFNGHVRNKNKYLK